MKIRKITTIVLILLMITSSGIGVFAQELEMQGPASLGEFENEFEEVFEFLDNEATEITLGEFQDETYFITLSDGKVCEVNIKNEILPMISPCYMYAGTDNKTVTSGQSYAYTLTVTHDYPLGSKFVFKINYTGYAAKNNKIQFTVDAFKMEIQPGMYVKVENQKSLVDQMIPFEYYAMKGSFSLSGTVISDPFIPTQNWEAYVSMKSFNSNTVILDWHCKS